MIVAKLIDDSRMVLLLLGSLVSFGCGSLSATAGENRVVTTVDQPRPTQGESRPIIEIWKDLDGSVPLRGRSLHFRLYDDRVVEFDYELRREMKSGTPRYTFSVERTPPTRISTEEYRRLRSLIGDLKDSNSARKEYGPVALTLDVFTTLTIFLTDNGTSRKIVVNDADYDVTSSKHKESFPKSLVDLLSQIQLVRAAGLKQFTP